MYIHMLERASRDSTCLPPCCLMRSRQVPTRFTDMASPHCKTRWGRGQGNLNQIMDDYGSHFGGHTYIPSTYLHHPNRPQRGERRGRLRWRQESGGRGLRSRSRRRGGRIGVGGSGGGPTPTLLLPLGRLGGRRRGRNQQQRGCRRLARLRLRQRRRRRRLLCSHPVHHHVHWGCLDWRGGGGWGEGRGQCL